MPRSGGGEEKRNKRNVAASRKAEAVLNDEKKRLDRA